MGRRAPSPTGLRHLDIARNHAPQSFASLSAPQRALLAERADSIAALGRKLADHPLPESLARSLPKSQSRLRLVPNIED